MAPSSLAQARRIGSAIVQRSPLPVGQFAAATGAKPVSASLGPDGRFLFLGVVPGIYHIRTSAGAGGWFPKSAVIGGRDALDFPLEVVPYENLSGLTLMLSKKPAALTGSLVDAMSRPTSEYMIVLFPTDPQYWLPQSRRIRAAHPSTDGRFTFGDLPAGRYRLAAVTPTEEGTWYDPVFLQQLMSASIAISLAEGETQMQTLRVGG